MPRSGSTRGSATGSSCIGCEELAVYWCPTLTFEYGYAISLEEKFGIHDCKPSRWPKTSVVPRGTRTIRAICPDPVASRGRRVYLYVHFACIERIAWYNGVGTDSVF